MAKIVTRDISIDFIKQVGANIKKKRLKKGWSLEQLGLEVGLTRMQINRIEKGYNITLSTILKIALALEITPDSVIKVKFAAGKEHLEGLVDSSKSNKQRPSK